MVQLAIGQQFADAAEGARWVRGVPRVVDTPWAS